MARKRRIEYAYELAQLNIERTRQELSQVPDFDSRLISSLVPELPKIDFPNLPLYPTVKHPKGIFASRADYERTLRYLDRINRAASSSYGSGSEQTMLTSFATNGDTLQSEFMRRESQYAVQRENKRRLQALHDEGIEMTRTPVYRFNEETGEYTQVYTESRHPLYQWVPATPEAQRRYLFATRQNAQIGMIQPEIPEDAVVVMWGDVVPAQHSQGRTFKPKEIARQTQQDYQDALRVEGYFANMQEVIDTVLPDYVSDELDRVFEAIQKESPERMYEIYRAMAGKGKYKGLYNENEPSVTIMTLDYLYPDLGLTPSKNVQLLINNLNNIVLPMLSEKIAPIGELEDAELTQEEMQDLENGNFLSIYQRIKGGRGHGITYQMLRSYRGQRGE